jgi:hypothetical protein
MRITALYSRLPSAALISIGGLALVWQLACGSPLAPGECRNGHDGQGRGPITSLSMACAPTGSDLRCAATLGETGYCATPDKRDVTSLAAWSSSNPSVGMFTAPGVLRAIAPGEVEVAATYNFNTAFSRDFTLAPAAPPEEMVHLLVIVEDATVPGKRIADATIEVTPERGPTQRCQSSSTGACFFWVFPTTVHARASRTGYQPAEASSAPPNAGGLNQNVNLVLSPSS